MPQKCCRNPRKSLQIIQKYRTPYATLTDVTAHHFTPSYSPAPTHPAQDVSVSSAPAERHCLLDRARNTLPAAHNSADHFLSHPVQLAADWHPTSSPDFSPRQMEMHIRYPALSPCSPSLVLLDVYFGCVIVGREWPRRRALHQCRLRRRWLRRGRKW